MAPDPRLRSTAVSLPGRGERMTATEAEVSPASEM
eukprot:COSAG01_NODE_37867_length_497_cov_17.198492_1_plen_34_part_01